MEIKSGEFVAIVGPSGSGKTTLLNLLGCIDKATEGEILFDNEDITKLKENELENIRRYKIGYIFQFFNLIPTLTNLENAELPLWAVKSNHRKEGKIRVRHLFKELNIEHLMFRFPSDISGGEKQRVAVIRALANKPSLILADEPTGNLDSKTARTLIEIFKKENREYNTTFIVATHDTQIISEFDKVVYLKDGTIEKIES